MTEAIENLIPHRPPMRWVDALTECTDTTATAIVRLTPEHFAMANGALLESALVECAAQTAAAALGHRRRAAGGAGAANQGMLAAVSHFRITARPEAGCTLTIAIREVKRFGPMLLVSAAITNAGRTIAAGELSLYA